MTSRTRLRLLLSVAVLSAAQVVVACVGDEAATAPGGTSSGGVGDGGGPNETGLAGEAAGPDAADAADAAKSCKPLAPFDAPVLLGGINLPGVAVSGARLSPNALTLYYTRNTPPVAGPPVPIDELFFVTRSAPGSPFRASSSLLSDPNYNKRAANPTLTANQDTMFFNSTGFTAGSAHLCVSSRVSSATDFTTAGVVTFVAGPTDSIEPYANADASRVYYVSSGKIYVASKQGTSYADIVEVVPVAAGSSLSHPVVSADELTMWLSKDDGTPPAKIFVTQRKGLDVAFDVPVAFDSLNAELPAYPSWISPDGCDLYLTVAHKQPPVVDTGTFVETHVFRASRTPN